MGKKKKLFPQESESKGREQRAGPGPDNRFKWEHPMTSIAFTKVPQTGHEAVRKHRSLRRIFEIQITTNTISKLEL